MEITNSQYKPTHAFMLVNSVGHFTVRYANDRTIIFGGKHIKTFTEVGQQALELSENWCNANSLGFNPIKTVSFRLIPITMNYLNVNRTLQIYTKYLGLTINRKLSFLSQIKIKRNTILLQLLVEIKVIK